MAGLPSRLEALRPTIEYLKGISSHPKLEEALKKSKPPMNLPEYTSRYHDEKYILEIRVFAKDGQLYWTFQGLEPVVAPLFHHKGHIFDSRLDGDELHHREGWVGSKEDPAFGQIKFETSDKGDINGLRWAHGVESLPVKYKRFTFG